MFGDFLVSMPFLSYGGPVGTVGARAALARSAAAEARELGVELLELRTRNALPGLLEPGDRKITVVLDLPPTSKELWEDGLRSKVRSQVRRPMKEGMEVRFGPDQIGPFYEVFSRTMRDLGTPVLPRGFFRALQDHFPEQVEFGSVILGKEAVATGCGFFWNGEFEITWAGALREHSRLAPNMLLYWSFMEHAIARGCHTFNFGRCTPGSGTHRFKLQWGGRDEPLPWIRWSGGEKATPPTPETGKYGLAISLWQKMPVAITNRVGPLISRNLP
jgi:FemAB-related protein (PEP-CTERM system-associated)